MTRRRYDEGCMSYNRGIFYKYILLSRIELIIKKEPKIKVQALF